MVKFIFISLFTAAVSLGAYYGFKALNVHTKWLVLKWILRFVVGLCATLTILFLLVNIF